MPRALSAGSAIYGRMDPTPNSSFDNLRTTDEDADFGTNVGEKILEQPEARQVIAEVTHPMETGWGACNVGRTEQKIRLAAGAALLAAAAFARVNPRWKIAMGIFGAMEIVTGSTRHCPVWSALGVNTARGEEC